MNSLLVGGDPNNKFAVEPRKATGHTAVSLKVNSQNLDYENANERKFLLLVEAKEVNGGKLSSTATVTVEVLDLNDNSPQFPKDSYTAIVPESSPEGTKVISIVAEDRDSGDYGSQGIRYKLSGQGAELFNVDPISGTITVASCVQNCLDYETIQAYYLSYSATDNNGEGKKTVINLRISVADSNDNPPKFAQKVYKASINEGESKFEPQLYVKANDLDDSSILIFKILDGNSEKLFALDRVTGEIKVRQRKGLRLDNILTDMIILTVEVTDGENKDTSKVEINVKDVNDRKPIFEKKEYLSSVPEIAPIGTPIENVHAEDADFGRNAEIQYRISKGAYDDFAINAENGEISLSGELDYDRRDSYSIEIIAVDGGVPALSGTATLTVSVMNKNNKEPYFLPATQRAQITEDKPIGTFVLQLNATDPDVTSQENLFFDMIEPITAVDKDGARVSDSDGRFKNYFKINDTTGEVFVAEKLDRSVASIVTMTVSLTDTSADPVQVGYGNLVVAIVDVNDFPPAFLEPWTLQNPFLSISVPEEQPKGTIVHTFRATDADSNIDRFRILNPSKNKRPFEIDADTGDLIISDRIDYEELEDKQLTFELAVYDAGVPQFSAMARVTVNIENLNDESPIFELPQGYSVSIPENSPAGTEIIKVKATDSDEGEFGQVTYEITDPSFAIDPIDGTVTVVNSDFLDRESNPEITLQIVAKDVAPNSKTTSVPLNITVTDVNDNAPRFKKKVYTATIIDNIPFNPASPIIQLLAEDADIGKNGALYFYIIGGNEKGQFKIDNSKGIIYPNTSFVGQKGATFELTVQVYDEAGTVQAWTNPDQAIIAISVENVNTHQPEWFPDPPPNETIELLEEEDISNYVILKVLNVFEKEFETV